MNDEIAKAAETTRLNDEVILWLKQHALVIKTVKPQEDQEDLDPFREMVGASQVVGLGEATHGNKEFFQIKHRLIKFLVTQMGFDTVVFESPQQRAKQIEHYIKTSEEDKDQILEGLGYEVWKTQEVLDLINWLRDFNATSDRKISFYGCDVDNQTGLTGDERDKRMAENVLKILKEKPDSKIAIWAHNAHVSYADSSNLKSLGRNLKDELSDKYMCFGMLFNQGSANARVGNLDTEEFPNKPSPVSLEPVSSGSYEYFFTQTQLSLAVFNLRATNGNSLFDSWRSDSYTVREMGWAYDPKYKEHLSHKVDLANAFDGIVWMDSVTPTTPR